MKRGGLVIPDLLLSAERAYNTSKAASEVLVDSLLRGSDLNYLAHKYCTNIFSADGQKQRDYSKIEMLTIGNNLADGEEFNGLRSATENGAWIAAIPQRLNGKELSRK